jgi:hypothetical protein
MASNKCITHTAIQTSLAGRLCTASISTSTLHTTLTSILSGRLRTTSILSIYPAHNSHIHKNVIITNQHPQTFHTATIGQHKLTSTTAIILYQTLYKHTCLTKYLSQVYLSPFLITFHTCNTYISARKHIFHHLCYHEQYKCKQAHIQSFRLQWIIQVQKSTYSIIAIYIAALMPSGKTFLQCIYGHVIINTSL